MSAKVTTKLSDREFLQASIFIEGRRAALEKERPGYKAIAHQCTDALHFMVTESNVKRICKAINLQLFSRNGETNPLCHLQEKVRQQGNVLRALCAKLGEDFDKLKGE